jgi:hypothetical protein
MARRDSCESLRTTSRAHLTPLCKKAGTALLRYRNLVLQSVQETLSDAVDFKRTWSGYRSRVSEPGKPAREADRQLHLMPFPITANVTSSIKPLQDCMQLR